MVQSTTAEAARPACWFMGSPFQRSLVYDRMLCAQYDYVVGIDVGHGETVAYLFRRLQASGENGGAAVERLRMNYEDDAKLPTLIRFTSGGAVIGRKARNAPGFFQHFKVEPAKWETKIDAEHTHQHLLEAFIGALWRQILHYQPKLAEAAARGRVLLTAGCPASEAWASLPAMERYQALLRRATQCPHVSVLPESTAAIMAAVLSAEETQSKALPMEEGVAVLDAGSSTLDFTYVQMGKRLITRSLRLGGYDLDEQMLETALEDSGLTRAQIPQEQRQMLLVQLREMKEAFYPSQDSLGVQVIPIWGVDSEGRADPEVPSGLQLQFTMNAAFMGRALNRQSIQLNGHFSPKQSWLELCREFVQYTKALAGPCGGIILTGGTSFVSGMRDMVQQIYGVQVLQSRDPSSSVAKGLCYGKSLEIRGRDYVEEYRAFAEKLSADQYQAFVRELSAYIVQVVCDDMRDCAASASAVGPLTVGQFTDSVNQRAREDGRLVGEAGQQAIQELFSRHFSDAVGKIHEEVNKISDGIYGVSLTAAPRLSQLTAAQKEAILQNLNLASLINQTWITAIVPGILFSTLSSVLYAFAFGLIAIQPLTAAALLALAVTLDSDGFQEKVTAFVRKNNTKLSAKFLGKIARRLTAAASRSEIEKKAAAKTEQAVGKVEILQPEFVSGLQDQAEIALGKVLFLVYDSKPS